MRHPGRTNTMDGLALIVGCIIQTITLDPLFKQQTDPLRGIANPRLSKRN
jgi:hypothetical protein